MLEKEILIRLLLTQKFPSEEVFYNKQYSWLLGKNKHPLSLDIYYPNLFFAVELCLDKKDKEQDMVFQNKRTVCSNRNIRLYRLHTSRKSLRCFADTLGLTLTKEQIKNWRKKIHIPIEKKKVSAKERYAEIFRLQKEEKSFLLRKRTTEIV